MIGWCVVFDEIVSMWCWVFYLVVLCSRVVVSVIGLVRFSCRCGSSVLVCSVLMVLIGLIVLVLSISVMLVKVGRVVSVLVIYVLVVCVLDRLIWC